ncbi:MAG: CRISPR-associated endonuclease Cas2 [Planctomycetes bacterium]|nr:CRISPR-associated endonuclease Cas2 [Planctomycetota bacterium]
MVAYDVSDDRRRRRAERLIMAIGDRVQFSLFKVSCTPRNLMRLRWELSRVLVASDRLLVIPLTDSIAHGIPTIAGDREPEAVNDRGFRIIG